MGQRGLRAVIIFEAINDIGTSTNPEETARQLIEAYQVMIKKARQRGLKVYMGTITPFNGCKGYFTEARDAARKTVNEWIRTTMKSTVSSILMHSCVTLHHQTDYAKTARLVIGCILTLLVIRRWVSMLQRDSKR